MFNSEDFENFRKKLAEAHSEMWALAKELRAAHPDTTINFSMDNEMVSYGFGAKDPSYDVHVSASISSEFCGLTGYEQPKTDEEKFWAAEKKKGDFLNKKVSEVVAALDGMNIKDAKEVMRLVSDNWIDQQSFFINTDRLGNKGIAFDGTVFGGIVFVSPLIQ